MVAVRTDADREPCPEGKDGCTCGPLPTYEGRPYTATQALAASMIKTGLRPDAAMLRADIMQAEMLAMGYQIVPVKVIA